MTGLFQFFKRSLINFEYGVLIPLLSLLPDKFAFFFFRIRGLLQYYTNFEWKGVSMNSLFMRQETDKAIRKIVNNDTGQDMEKLVKFRFINESYDEYLSSLYNRKKINTILNNLEIENLEKLTEIKEKHGIVFVSTHYDAFTLGLMGLGYYGLNMNVINTRGITNKSIPLFVRKFYKKKYLAMEKKMNGKMPFVEDNISFFTDVLNMKDCVGLMGDIPGKKSTVFLDFFGKNFKMPLGAWKFAMETNSMLSGFVCIRLQYHKYKIFTVEPYLPNENPYESLKPIYDFLLGYIKRNPEKWLASYLLNGY